MPGVLADVNVEGQCAILVSIWNSEPWQELWIGLDYSLESFASLSLPPNAPDLLVWQTCQAKQLVLITGNRNQRGADSLEATIVSHNTPDSLPVITLANPKRIIKEKAIAGSAGCTCHEPNAVLVEIIYAGSP